MKKNKKFSGVIVPAVTPLTRSLEIDDAAVGKIFEQFYTYNISPFILGTTGESASLPADVKEQYVKAAAKHKKTGSLVSNLPFFEGCEQEQLGRSLYRPFSNLSDGTA